MRVAAFLRRHGVVLGGSLILLLTIGCLTLILFLRSSAALERQLRETLRAAAVSAAFSIDGDDLRNIRNEEDMQRPEYIRISALLRNIINELPQARFAYILRRTDNPHELAFVIDADATAPIEVLDRNGNGAVDTDEEPAYPGDLYGIADIPALQDAAFREPTTDPEVTEDQWGFLLSGYSPIRSRTTGEVVAVLGIDMDAGDFRSNTRSVLSPFAAVLIVTLAGMVAAGVALLLESRHIKTLSRVNAERSGLLQLTFHQLGEPITILHWGLETLDDAKGDAAELQKILPENLTDMREGVHRLGSIIDTLQEAERVELQVLENKPVEVSVKRVLTDAIAVVAPTLPDGTNRVALDVPDIACVFDPHLLTIVLRRLIENALEFSDPTSIVHVRAHEEGRWLHIDVADTGCGIPADDLPKLFEKYHRASNARTMKPDGNGLGLYIAKGVVELMEGHIAIASQEGKGTTVTVRLPLSPKRRG